MASDRTSADFGGKLRDARERRGVSLRQIANATKISVSALEALERNNFSRLPGGIFSRAFVRSYAIEVGLDPEQTIQDFLAQLPHETVTVSHPPAAPAEDGEALESDRRMASTFLRLIALSVPLAALVIYLGASGRMSSSHDAPRSVSAEAKPPAPAPPIASEPTTAAAPPLPAPPPAPDAGRSGASSDTKVEDDVSRLTVSLSAARPCWVSATVDGEKRIERLLSAGERQTLEVTRELVLTAADASAIRMTINGIDAKPLGKADQVVTARVNLMNFKSYLPR